MKALIKKIPALCACGMALAGFEACEENEINKPRTKKFTVSVDLNDGEETWDAAEAAWDDDRDQWGEVNLYFQSPNDYPVVMGCILPEGTTEFPGALELDRYLFFEYYSMRWPSVSRDLIYYQYGVPIPVGDWQTESGTVAVTSLTPTRISGTANIVLYDFYDKVVKENANPAKKTLTITFTDVPLHVASQSKIMQKIRIESRR